MPKLATAPDYLDIAFKLATILIAAFNLLFAIKIFRHNNKKSSSEKEKDRKIHWFKTLVLDHNLKYFYDFFDKIETDLAELKQENLSDERKREIDDKLADHFIVVRRKFTDTLIALDKNLYDNILKNTDELQTHFSSAMFDAGINLSHSPKYDEIISEKLTTIKTDILKNLFSYRG